jgi:hypothetical protein
MGKAEAWLYVGREAVVARGVLTGHGGNGITIIEPDDKKALPYAPLYTKYIPKKSEFRVHFMRGYGAFKFQRKARVLDYPEEKINWKVRNIGNGFIYALADDISDDLKDRLKNLASNVSMLLQLDFFCLDVIYNMRRDMLYLLEVNTAPGLSDNTAAEYAEAFDWMRGAFERGDMDFIRNVKPYNKPPEQEEKRKPEKKPRLFNIDWIPGEPMMRGPNAQRVIDEALREGVGVNMNKLNANADLRWEVVEEDHPEEHIQDEDEPNF